MGTLTATHSFLLSSLVRVRGSATSTFSLYALEGHYLAWRSFLPTPGLALLFVLRKVSGEGVLTAVLHFHSLSFCSLFVFIIFHYSLFPLICGLFHQLSFCFITNRSPPHPSSLLVNIYYTLLPS